MRISGWLLRAVLLTALVATVPMPTQAQWGGGGECAPWNPSMCPAPSLTLRLDKAAYTQCDWGVSLQIDLGTGYVESLRTTATDPAGTAWHDSFQYAVGGPTAWKWLALAPSADGSWPYGPHTITATAQNVNGVSTQATVFTLSEYVDTTPPATFAHFYSSTGPATDGWYGGQVWGWFSGYDDCKFPTVQVKVNGNDTGPYLHVKEEGRYQVEHRGTDINGNVEAWKMTTFGIDLTPPTVRVAKPAAGDIVIGDQSVVSNAGEKAVVIGPVTLTADASDNLSGVATIAWEVDGVIVGHGNEYPYIFAPGTHVVVSHATDKVGRTRASAPVTLDAL